MNADPFGFVALAVNSYVYIRLLFLFFSKYPYFGFLGLFFKFQSQ